MSTPIDTIGSFVPTNYIFDVSQLYQTEINSPEFKELIVRLYQYINNIAFVLNTKDSAYYLMQQFATSGLMFSTTNDVNNMRPLYRIVVNCGALPNAATKTIPHGITPTDFTSSWTFLKIYGAASDTTGKTYIPLPYSSAAAIANNIEVKVDSTNVYITTGINYSNYNVSYIILEYIKN